MSRPPSPSRRRSRSPRRSRDDDHPDRGRRQCSRSPSSASSSSRSSGSDGSRSRRRRDDRNERERRRRRHGKGRDDGLKKRRPEGVDRIDVDSVLPERREAFVGYLTKKTDRTVDELSSKKLKKYLKKFAKAWNHGLLAPKLYADTSRSGPSNLTRPSTLARNSLSDLQYAREAAQEAAEATRAASRAQARRERREIREEQRDERATGRDRLIEKRRELNEERRGYERAKDEAGLEVDERTLMGGGDSFAAAVAARDRARERRQERRHGAKEERDAARQDVLGKRKQREDDTMAMFRSLAASRFGPVS